MKCHYWSSLFGATRSLAVLSHQIIDWHAQLPSFKAPPPCSNLVTNFPSGFTFCQLGTEGVLKCSKPSKLAEEIWTILEHPTPVHVITRLCPRRGLGLAWTRLLGFQQSAIEAPSTQAFCFAYPAFPIKRKSRKLNPKLPAPPPPQSHAHQADCLQKLNQILGRKSQKSQEEKGGRGGSPRCMGSVSGPTRPNSLQH